MNEYLTKRILEIKLGRTLHAAANDETAAADTAGESTVVLFDAHGNPLSAMPNSGEFQLVPRGQEFVGARSAANAATSLASLQNQRLTNFAVGRPRDAIMELVDFMAPGVRAPYKFNYTVYSKANRYADAGATGDMVGSDGLPAMVNFDAKTNADGTLAFRGLETAFTQTDRDAATAMPGGSPEQERQDRIEFLTDMIYRGIAARVIALFASTAGGATGKTWDANANPIEDLYEEITTVAVECGGRQFVRVTFGYSAWHILVHQAKVAGGANYPYMATTRQRIADLLDIPAENIHVSYLQAATSKQGKTDAKSALFTASELYIHAASQNPSRFDPSTVKRFFMELNGNMVMAYTYDKHPLVEGIGLGYYEKLAATNSAAIKRLSISDR